MRTAHPNCQCLRSAVAAAAVLVFLPACKPSAPASGPVKSAIARTNTFPAVAKPISNEYTSVFEDLMPPKGKDPFFPNSHRRDPVAVMVTSLAEKPPPAAGLVLKGVLGTANHRAVVINNISLEVGESGSARVPEGHVRIKCMEIGEDFAVLQVEGEIQTKRLQLKKKGF